MPRYMPNLVNCHTDHVKHLILFKPNCSEIYSGDFEVAAKILVVRKYGDFFRKSPNFVPRKYVS